MNAPTLKLTRPLLQWLKADPAWRDLSLSLRAWLCWQANLGSLNHSMARRILAATPRPDGASIAPYGEAVQQEIIAPIFVIGPWRSGTTAMHEALASSADVITPRQWQCMAATTFTHFRPPGKLAARRPMDGLWIHPQAPQEDEFALMTLGVESLYRAFWMPHRLAELGPLLEQEHWLGDRTWISTWLEFLRGVRMTESSGDRKLLLKSPNHTFRLRAILEALPDARFIWMARDARSLAASNFKMWHQMFALHGLTAPRPSALPEFLDHVWNGSAQALEHLRRSLPRDRWVVIDQRELQRDAPGVISAVCQQFGLIQPMIPLEASGTLPLLPPAAMVAPDPAVPPDTLDSPSLKRFAEVQTAALLEV
jgi:hypothetical protein